MGLSILESANRRAPKSMNLPKKSQGAVSCTLARRSFVLQFECDRKGESHFDIASSLHTGIPRWHDGDDTECLLVEIRIDALHNLAVGDIAVFVYYELYDNDSLNALFLAYRRILDILL